MGWFQDLFNVGSSRADTLTGFPTHLEIDKNGYFYHYLQNVNNTVGGLTAFNPASPMRFALSLAEIFIPLDIIADRVASCDYVLYSKSKNAPVIRVPQRIIDLLKRPNPLQDVSSLVYDIMFFELACGGSYTLTKRPQSLKGKTYENITNIWALDPDTTHPKILRSIPDPFMISDISELIESYRAHFINDVNVSSEEVIMNVITRVDDSLKPVSPLLEVQRNINNLLATYSARYNVYVNNGSAKIIARKGNREDFVEQVNPQTRQQIIDDISKRDGITGNKNFVAISSIPLEAIETLGKIKELEPFRETYADAITIGGIYGVDKELLPKEESTTFSNKQDAEKHLWQNVIIPYAAGIAKTLTRAMYLPDDWEIRAVTEHIEVLQDDRLTKAQAEGVELDNLAKKEALGIDTTKEKEQWKQ